jgi:CRP-like cAMP-binding protein
MKSHHVLIQYLQSKTEICDSIIFEVLEKFISISKKKKEILVNKGDICTHIFFLVTGITRNFYIDINGLEYTRLITYQSKFFNNFLSFQKQKPSRETIECLENTELLGIAKSDFYYLISKHPQLFKLFTYEVVEYHNFHLEKLEFLSLLTPKEKIKYIIDNEKYVFDNVTNKILASYIGVSPETCSRLKNILKH